MANKEKKGIKRRKFLQYSAAGVGLMIGVGCFARNRIRRTIAGFANTAESPYLGSTDPRVWFQITPDNKIILHSSKVEMGQGTFTGLAQIAADELEVDVSLIQVIHATSATGNIDQFATGGSTSISSLWQPLREMAATVREMLMIEASKKLGIDKSKLTNHNGTISGNGQTFTYGEIVQGVEKWEIPDIPPLKDVSEYKYVGKPIPRVDLEDKVLGAPIFGIDAMMPNMVYGSVVRPRLVDATYISCDSTEAEKMPGVIKIVKEKDFVGVVAHSMIEAENARKKLKVEWEVTKNWDLQDIEEMIKVGSGKPIEIQTKGKAQKILDKSSEVIEMEFKSPIGAHAQMEPNGAVADVTSDQATIIMSTQVIKLSRSEIADRIGISKDKVNIVPTYLGGGFGRRLHTPNAIQAAVMSKAVGRPVKCFFDRKQEFQNDTFRPPTHHLLRATLNGDGTIEAMEHNVSSGDVAFGSAIIPGFAPAILGADVGAWRGGMIQYRNIPNHRAVSWRVKLPFATSFWRSLGLLANTFAIESFMDHLALKAKVNPVQFRLNHIHDDKAGRRLRKVIEVCAEKSNYQDTPVDGRAMGFAASTDANSPCAHVAEVSIENNSIKVHKVTCVLDCGIAVNPDQVKAQCEGCVIMGMSASMFEKMDLKGGKLFPINYGAYDMALMKDAPKEIDVFLVQGDDKPGAVGEPPLGPIAAAIANAVFRLTGQRLTEMPLTLS